MRGAQKSWEGAQNGAIGRPQIAKMCNWVRRGTEEVRRGPKMAQLGQEGTDRVARGPKWCNRAQRSQERPEMA